jgi:hypothetical protein
MNPLRFIRAWGAYWSGGYATLRRLASAAVYVPVCVERTIRFRCSLVASSACSPGNLVEEEVMSLAALAFLALLSGCGGAARRSKTVILEREIRA